jgi:hypothetical protein
MAILDIELERATPFNRPHAMLSSESILIGLFPLTTFGKSGDGFA